MCIAIFKPVDAKALPREVLQRCATQNPHGMGVMWPHKGRIQMYKTMNDFEAFLAVVRAREFDRVPIVLHFRLATHGSKSLANCHPFYVPDTDGTLGIVHNGIISEMPDCKQDRSDTRVFADEVLGMLKEGWMESDAVVKLLERGLGSNKVVVMRGNGDVLILNRKSGEEDMGCWFSNTGYKYTYSTISNGAWFRRSDNYHSGSWHNIQGHGGSSDRRLLPPSTSEGSRPDGQTVPSTVQEGAQASSEAGAEGPRTAREVMDARADDDADEVVGYYLGNQALCLVCAANHPEIEVDGEEILATEAGTILKCDKCERDIWEGWIEMNGEFDMDASDAATIKRLDGAETEEDEAAILAEIEEERLELLNHPIHEQPTADTYEEWEELFATVRPPEMAVVED